MTDAIVVLHEGMRRFIADLYPDKQIDVLPNAVNVAEMTNSRGIKREPARLLFLGSYLKEKGVYELVDAMALLRERGIYPELDFYGNKEVENLRAYVEKKHLATTVHVNGWIDGEEKIDAFYASTMLVLPSHTEGMPNVILEAMATRTPIVSTASGGLKEMLTDGENAVIVAVNDPDDLAAKIERCVADPHQRETIAKNAYREALEHYDVGVIRDQFRHLLKRLA
jgi:glycosyltransferase involved in cell wall biosynthesis